MSKLSAAVRLTAAVGAAVLLASGCSSGAPSPDSDSGGGGPVAGGPPWCGSKKITVGLLDGFGGNSWRLVTTASAKAEIAKCASVTSFSYADGQGNTQKAISDIQGMVAKGVGAIVVFPDAGNAMLPALRSAYKANVVTVPYRVDPGGKDGTDYNVWVGASFANDGK